MANLKEVLAKIEQGSSWVSYDRVSGVGPGKVAITVEPGWMGRLPRETYVAVEKGKVTKLATIVQRGVERVEVDPKGFDFPMEGGTMVVNARLNSASVKASMLTVGGSVSSARILSINVNGLSMQVPDEDSRYVVYADPDDPGAGGLYDASFLIAMPENLDNAERHEMFMLNGKVVNLTQRPNDKPFIELDHDFDNVSSEEGQVSIEIRSNIDYDIELVCCTCDDGGEEPTGELTVIPDTIALPHEGGSANVTVSTDDDTVWTIEERR